MAQLRYTKYAMVCGTAAITAGLVGLYLYRNKTKKDRSPLAKKDQESKTDIKGESLKEELPSADCSSTQRSSLNAQSEKLEFSDEGQSQNEVVQKTIAEEAQDMFALMDNVNDSGFATNANETETLPVDKVIEEQVTQAIKTSLESAIPDNGLPSEGEISLTLDWATATMQQDQQEAKSPVSPTTSVHSHPEGSMAGSDLGSESNSDSSSFDSGRCTGSTTSTGAVQQLQQPVAPEMPTVYRFEFPADLCGRLIGKAGKNIKGIRNRSGAKVTLLDMPEDETLQICVVEGFQSQIDAALKDIQHKFPAIDTSKQYIKSKQIQPDLVAPEISTIHLHDEIINDVLVSSVVSAGHVFIQQPTHPTYMALPRLDSFMNNCYSQVEMTPPLPRPIEVGVICAAPIMQGWYRAQVVDIYPDTEEVDLKFLDYGGYARTDSCVLKQIRTDFMSLPFQATECYLSNIAPLADEEDFSETARIFVEQVAQSFAILQGQVTSYSEDGVPFVELFYTDSERRIQSLNKELVNQGLVMWFEDSIEMPSLSSENTSLVTEELITE
ncbi:A-kinase anchor protein 1, mitochondrial-like [Asterias amurensis]|uniref:A-kinase anchor protein 1, mitochondrial-like n=1 Tax=Asterias amurensis TaxID=7602 RepID=UPI003AB80372